MKKLTVKQFLVAEFIVNFLEKEKFAPSVYEISDHFMIKTSTVFSHLKALQKKGYIIRSRKARSIIILKDIKSIRKKYFSNLPENSFF